MIESREFEVKERLQAERKNIKTFDELVSYLQNIKENYNCGYGEAPRAIAQAALATGYYLSHEFGITGFQAGFVMWDFISDWLYTDNKCGMKLVDFDDMLYPQYYDKYDKTINTSTWNALQKEAETLLKDRTYVHPNVVAHWESIVSGVVPFGYKVKED